MGISALGSLGRGRLPGLHPKDWPGKHGAQAGTLEHRGACKVLWRIPLAIQSGAAGQGRHSSSENNRTASKMTKSESPAGHGGLGTGLVPPLRVGKEKATPPPEPWAAGATSTEDPLYGQSI